MNTKVTARHFDLTPELKERAEEEIASLTRYFDRIISAEFIFDAERHRRSAELKVKVYNQTIAAKSETDDIYTAMGASMDKVKVQLKKYKGKLKEHKQDEIAEVTESATKPTTDVDEVEM